MATSRSKIRSIMLCGAMGVWISLFACTPAPASSPPSAALSPSPSSSPTTSSSAPAARATPSTSVSAVTIDITIASGKVSPSGRKIDVVVGDKVILDVRSDVNETIHAHGAGDGYELDVTAGKQATGSFVANDPGRFVVEAHELEKVIAILSVR